MDSSFANAVANRDAAKGCRAIILFCALGFAIAWGARNDKAAANREVIVERDEVLANLVAENMQLSKKLHRLELRIVDCEAYKCNCALPSAPPPVDWDSIELHSSPVMEARR